MEDFTNIADITIDLVATAILWKAVSHTWDVYLGNHSTLAMYLVGAMLLFRHTILGKLVVPSPTESKEKYKTVRRSLVHFRPLAKRR
jgi:hypothetical protein